uniref:Myeloid leukemia factor 2 n=1 Tax=Varanus komodoensis TaxID=61221 RepID=A0A8D2IT85_VARKO
MFRFMRDGEPEDPMFVMDPLAIHHQHVNRVLSGGFGYSPFLSIGNGTIPGTRQTSRRMPAGGFMDMFGMMNDMIGNMEHMTSGANCQTFTSSTVISYSNLGDGPKVYQETSETRSAPGGIRETRRTVRDSDSGLEQMSIGHHIRERAHIMQRSRNHRTGDQEERQDYINLDESECSPQRPSFLGGRSPRGGACLAAASRLLPQAMRQHLMMSGGERHPASGHREGWITGVTRGATVAGLRGPALLFRDLRSLRPDSRAGMTGESRADLRGGAMRSPPNLPSCSCTDSETLMVKPLQNISWTFLKLNTSLVPLLKFKLSD